jgi:hypothetical protein
LVEFAQAVRATLVSRDPALQPKLKSVRMSGMIQRRTLLSALPFLAACARAQSAPAAISKADMTGMPDDAVSQLTGGPGKVVWFNFTGTVRLKADNANVRPATLLRAIATSAQGSTARVFDIWQIARGQPIAAPSVTQLASTDMPAYAANDAGTQSVWLNRSFVHPALNRPIETSRMATVGARVIAIDATQIWLLEGGVTATQQALTGPTLAAYTAWMAGT